jgi:hypothetical protein
MAENWWSIEVVDAELTADQWRESWSGALIEAAVSHGAQDWDWHRTPWGLVLEVAFADWDVWAVYRRLPVVVAALDATPDPVNGLMIYPGRGGSANSRMPRRPRPIAGPGTAPIPAGSGAPVESAYPLPPTVAQESRLLALANH